LRIGCVSLVLVVRHGAAALLISSSGTVACLVMEQPRRVDNGDLPGALFWFVAR